MMGGEQKRHQKKASQGRKKTNGAEDAREGSKYAFSLLATASLLRTTPLSERIVKALT